MPNARNLRVSGAWQPANESVNLAEYICLVGHEDHVLRVRYPNDMRSGRFYFDPFRFDTSKSGISDIGCFLLLRA
jgi:hypothetical protein